MGMIEYANQKMSLAIQTDSFCDFLCGYDSFVIPDRDGYCSTDRGAYCAPAFFVLMKKTNPLVKYFPKV